MVKKLGKRGKRIALAKAKRQKGIKKRLLPDGIIQKLLFVGKEILESGLDITEEDVDEQIAYTKEQKAEEDLKEEIESIINEIMEKE